MDTIGYRKGKVYKTSVDKRYVRLTNVFCVESGGKTYYTLHGTFIGYEHLGIHRIPERLFLKEAAFKEWFGVYIDHKIEQAHDFIDQKFEKLKSCWK